jgi:hypothetical protein
MIAISCGVSGAADEAQDLTNSPNQVSQKTGLDVDMAANRKGDALGGVVV